MTSAMKPEEEESVPASAVSSAKATESKSSPSAPVMKIMKEDRDELDTSMSRDTGDEQREDRETKISSAPTQEAKPSPVRKPKSPKAQNHSSQQRPYHMGESFPSYHPPNAYAHHHGAMRGPPPAGAPYPHPHHHYYNAAHHHDYHRGPPQHYHQVHQMPGPYGGGPYGPPHANMSGRPRPSYPHPYPGNYPHPMGYPSAQYHGIPSNLTSDSMSISSSKSKKSSKSASTKNSRKKRNADGEMVQDNSGLDHQGTNIFDDGGRHRRSRSSTSTVSNLSVGGFSLESYDKDDEATSRKSSPKRQKGEGGERSKASDKADATDKENDKKPSGAFMSLSASPINAEHDATPLKANVTKKPFPKISIKTENMDEDTNNGDGKDDSSEIPTGSNNGSDSKIDAMTDEQLLNRHLRGQTFTPLGVSISDNISPSNAGFASLGPQLSWSIAGDTPSLDDLAACSWDDAEKRRPGSTTSQLSSGTRGMVISPHNFSLWKEEHESNEDNMNVTTGKGDDSIRFSVLSPHSEIAALAAGEGFRGTTTPLPMFFQDHSPEENGKKKGHPEAILNKDDLLEKGGPPHDNSSNSMWPKHEFPTPSHNAFPPTPLFATSKPPTPLFSGGSGGFLRSPIHGSGRDHRHMFGHPHHPAHNDRVRNLRGRAPVGAHYHAMPMHIPPPPPSSHHPLTSPMGIPGGKAPLWSPHPGTMPPPMASPHHIAHLDMSQSKRKCVSLKPPIPSKFQGDMEKTKTAPVPEFTSLVNFPAHMSQKQSVNLPEGMRCCVMCGSACPCSNGNKKKATGQPKSKSDGSISRVNSGQDNGYAIIPTQNKGLCTLCDVNVWVVVNSGLEIKWCKGCKNFRPWAAFGDKGLATKCLRCRERQREKYALQKEEKERMRQTKGKVKA